MSINKFTTLLDLARQAKILTGETATFDGKIQVGLPFSAYTTGVDTGSTVSLGVVSSETAVFSGNSGTTIFDVSNPSSPNYSPTYSGYTAFTWTNPLFSATTSGLTLPITIFNTGTQFLGPYWTLTQTGMTGDYVIGLQYTGYSITYSFNNVADISTTATTLYSGFTTATQENFSAGTLDYKGPLDYISSKEDATVDGRLTTNKITITNGASASTIGYILTQTTAGGEGEWQALTTAATNTFVTGGTLNTTDLVLGLNDGSTASPIELSGLTFTGNTSASCITDLYITNLYGCSPITVHDSIQYSGSTASGTFSTAIGIQTSATNNYSYAEGILTLSSGIGSHAEGLQTSATTTGSHSEGQYTIASGNGGAHSEGNNTTASGDASHAEGAQTTASGSGSHAEGQNTVASGATSHSEGLNTTASGDFSHAEGGYTTAIGFGAHSEGFQTLASGDYSHAEGNGTSATTTNAHSEGFQTLASGLHSHAEGQGTIASNEDAHAEGYLTTASGFDSHAEGDRTIASGGASHAEGSRTTASNNYSHAEGVQTIASGQASHAEGSLTIASGNQSHAEGVQTSATTTGSHAEGLQTTTGGLYSHAEGQFTTASGNYSHAEGNNTSSIGESSHSEGTSTSADGISSHAEGNRGIASGDYSHAEGSLTQSIGESSHAEGSQTIASGTTSHAEGLSTTASGTASHAEGQSTTASGDNSHAEGQGTSATTTNAHSEGFQTLASGVRSHAEGDRTTASGSASHAEGSLTIASGSNSHAENSKTTASGNFSHAEGSITTASGVASHAGGSGAIASGNTSFVHFNASGGTYGAYSDESAILGGINNYIDTLSNNSVILGGVDNRVVSSIPNTIILGGNGITATTGNTVYVPDLVIANLTSVSDLRTNADGLLIDGASDITLKKNIKTITDSLDKILKLNPVSFEWVERMKLRGGDVYGLIAQEVEKIIPQIVRERSNGNGTLTVEYKELIPWIISAIQEFISKYEEEKNIIEEYTPTSTNDEYGKIGLMTRDDDYIYIKGNNGWGRTKLENF